MNRILTAIANLIPDVDCCPHEDVERPMTLTTIRGEVQAAVEVIDSGRPDTARQILVTLLAALDKEVA